MKLIFIVGPARSGTSALATLVRSMGASTLPVTVVGRHNPNYQENAIVNAMAEAIHPWFRIEHRDITQHLWEGIALYIIENVKHMEREPSHLVVKSPCFPFIVRELDMIADFVGRIIPGEVYYLATERDRNAVVRSSDKFTGGMFGPEHWDRMVQAASNQMRARLDDRALWIGYEDMLVDWRSTAERIAKWIPGLSVPEDGGIVPELNHEGLRNAC